MVHEIYDVTLPIGYFSVQSGSGPFFEGMRFQRGYGRSLYGRGVLGVLSKFWKYMKPLATKYVSPLAKQALKALTDEGLDAGSKILTNITKGVDPKEAVITEGTQALKNLSKRAGATLTQAGSGKKRKTAKRKGKQPLTWADFEMNAIGRPIKKNIVRKIRQQNLGLY